MTSAEIRHLIELLPDDSPVWNRSHPVSVDERLALAYCDLSFGWKLASLYAQARQSLPCIIEQPSIRRAYYHAGGISDQAMEEAKLYTRPNTTQGRLLRALLFARDAGYETIAEYLKLNGEVVQLYSDLFFNVHDRLDDPMFVAEQLYPETRAVHLLPDYLERESPEWIMRRLAYEHGWRAAAQFAGSEPLPDSGPSVDQQAEAFERLTLNNGMLFARAGGLHSEKSPVIRHARGTVASRRKSVGPAPEQLDPLTRMSLDEACSRELSKLVQVGAMQRLKAEREWMAAEQAKVTAKA